MTNASNEKVEEIAHYYFQRGEASTLEAYNLRQDSLRRYLHKYRTLAGRDEFDRRQALLKIVNSYSLDELKTLADGKGFFSPFIAPHRVKTESKSVKFGVVSDSHIGSVFFVPEWWDSMIDKMISDKVDFIAHAGDVVEGMSGRVGHVYELTHIGYDRQRDYAIEQLEKWNGKWYLISGNHDLWVQQQSGADIVKAIAKELKDADYIGQHEGDLHINNIKIKLWHGADGSSYSTSYRIQKIVESLQGGSKPHILIAGHVHKSVYLPQERNIECISAGCMSAQSKWMRTKRLPAHSGYWIIQVDYDDGGITGFSPKWFPFYIT